MAGGAQMVLSLVAAFVAMGLIGNWDAAVNWMDAHQGVAGFAQFLGGILAIGGAFAVGNAQIRTAMKLEAERQRSQQAHHIVTSHALIAEALSLCVFIRDKWLDRRQFPLLTDRFDELGMVSSLLVDIDPFQCPDPKVSLHIAKALRLLTMAHEMFHHYRQAVITEKLDATADAVAMTADSTIGSAVDALVEADFACVQVRKAMGLADLHP